MVDKTQSIRMSTGVKNKLKAFCEKQGKLIRWVIDQAVSTYIKKHEKR